MLNPNGIKLVVTFCLLLSSMNIFAEGPTGENQPIAYYASGNRVIRLVPQNIANAQPLPDSLIILPGLYKFNGRVFKLDQAGLYRFYLVGTENQQRIVYNQDVHIFMSALAWISTHGSSDNYLSTYDLIREAKTRKLVISCGPMAALANTLLTQLGVRSRIVSTMTLDEWNDYDNGHVMLEVFYPPSKRWIVYDLDAKYFFMQNNVKLNLFELYQAAKTGNFSLVSLANTTRLDTVNWVILGSKYNYQFMAEEYMTNIKAWYLHVTQVLFRGNNFVCKDTPANRKRIEDATHMTFVDEATFKRLYY